MGAIEEARLQQALDRLWSEHLPLLEERVALLARASASLAAGTQSLEDREAANAAAHKLAGVLGTFGLTKGTVIAREAEIMYSGEPATDPAAAQRLAAIADELKAIVASKQPS